MVLSKESKKNKKTEMTLCHLRFNCRSEGFMVQLLTLNSFVHFWSVLYCFSVLANGDHVRCNDLITGEGAQ